MENQDKESIKELTSVNWKTALSVHIDKFKDTINQNDNFDRFFGEKYIEKLSEKYIAFQRTTIKLGAIYLVLILLLFATQSSVNSEFEFLGFGFKNLEQNKELLLLLSAIIAIVNSILNAYCKYIRAIIKEGINKVTSNNDDIGKFYSIFFIDDYFSWFPVHSNQEGRSWHGFTLVLLSIFVIATLILIAIIYIGSILVQIVVIYDVATKPASHEYFNTFVVIFTIASIFFSWLVTFMQLPLPEVDTSNYSKLTKIKEANPDQYKEILSNIANNNIKKEKRMLIFKSSILYIVTLVSLCLYKQPDILNDAYLFLRTSITGAILVLFVSTELCKLADNITWRLYFEKYPDESENRAKEINKRSKALKKLQLLVPILATVAYFYYAL
ncbi:MAG TPA: hypothetical protein VIM93_02070 [Kangiella sp.]